VREETLKVIRLVQELQPNLRSASNQAFGLFYMFLFVMYHENLCNVNFLQFSIFSLLCLGGKLP